MRFITVFVLLFLGSIMSSYGQATFLSVNSGDWTNPSNWIIFFGSDSDGNNYPDANDEVFIQNNHNITINGTSEFCKSLSLSLGNITFSGVSAQLNVRGELVSSNTSSIIGTSTDHRLIIVNNGSTVLGNIQVTGGTFTLDGARLTNNGTTIILDGTTFQIDDSTSPTVVANHLFTGLTIESGGTFRNNDAVPIIVRGNIINDGTFNGCIDNSCNYNYNDGGSYNITGTSTTNIPRILIYNGSTLTNQGVISTLDLLGNATGTNTYVNEGDLTLNTDGSVDEAELVLDFDAVGNSLTYIGSTNEQLFSATFHDVIVNLDDGILINLNNGVSSTINNNLTVTSGDARIITSANSLTVSGNVSIEGDGTFFMNNTSVGQGISITGDFDVSSTDATAVDLNNGTISFDNMTITNGADVFAGVADLTSTGTITVTNGSFNSDGTSTPTFNNLIVDASGSWISTSVYDPTVNGNITNNGVFTACSNTTGCDYTLTSVSGTIGGSNTITNLANLIINDGASYTNENTSSAGIQIGTGIQTTSGTGTFINGANSTLDYGGTIANFSVTNFTASAAGNTVIFSRTNANQQLRLTTDANNEYQNVTINKADGFDVTLEGAITISGELSMLVGDISLNGSDLTLSDGATATGGNSTSYIRINAAGRLIQEYSAAGATLAFPIGDDDDYSPINSLTLASGTFGASPSISFNITDAAHPDRDTGNSGAGGDDSGTAATSYISRYWTLSPTDISDVTFSATYTYVDADVVGTESSMIGTVYRTPIGTAFLDWSKENGVNAVSNLVSVTSVNSTALGDLYAMDNTLDRLPVDLLSFDAISLRDFVKLNWLTASEENNSFFSIERSIDGEHFTEIGQVAGNGTVEGIINYSFDDNFPLTGRSFYRLRQVDFNGQFEYSEVISVTWSASELNEVVLYPNPVSLGEEISVEISDGGINNSDWVLMNSAGQKLLSGQTNHNNLIQISTETLTPGIYLFRLHQGAIQTTRKVVIR